MESEESKRNENNAKLGAEALPKRVPPPMLDNGANNNTPKNDQQSPKASTQTLPPGATAHLGGPTKRENDKAKTNWNNRGGNKYGSSEVPYQKKGQSYKGREKSPYNHYQNKFYGQPKDNWNGYNRGQKGGFQPPIGHFKPNHRNTNMMPNFKSAATLTGSITGGDAASKFLSLTSPDKSIDIVPFSGSREEMLKSFREKHCDLTPPPRNLLSEISPKLISLPAENIKNDKIAGPILEAGSSPSKSSSPQDPVSSYLAKTIGMEFVSQSRSAASSLSTSNVSPDPGPPIVMKNINAPIPKPRQRLAISNAGIDTSAPSFMHTNSSTGLHKTNSDDIGDLNSLSKLMDAFDLNRETMILQRLQQSSQTQTPGQHRVSPFHKNKVDTALLEQCRRLPIYAQKDALVKAIRENQFLIVIGDTGSGKSTQIPQYLVEAGLHRNAKIAVTQPRRVAAKSLATRVATECGVPLGGVVGYAVRFDKNAGKHTIIKYLTDGMLVTECSSEANLDTYSIVIVDEAHERSIHTDVCFGLLKRAAERRSDLKVIVSSATLDVGKFSQFFNNAPVFTVNGNGFTVEIIYNPPSHHNFMHSAVDTVLHIARSNSQGDILVFLPGQEDIENTHELLCEYDHLLIVPCYGAQPLSEQQQIFMQTPPNLRKVILATNIAETSVTIDGIGYVVDPGLYKQSVYNSRTGIFSLETRKITKAIQRAGRAGRTQAGQCIRLYSRNDFELMKETPDPEITQSNLESVLLDIIALGIVDPLKFDFIDRPPLEAIAEGIHQLIELSALDGKGTLTDCGRHMAKFPLDPKLAKVILESLRLGCSTEVLKIVALLSTQHQNLFLRNKKIRQKSDASRAQFRDANNGDLATLLKVFDSWRLIDRNEREEWCHTRYIQHRILVEAEDVLDQLKIILEKRGIPSGMVPQCSSQNVQQNIRKAFTASYFRNLAKKQTGRGNEYQLLGDLTSADQLDVFVHPSSSLSRERCQFLIYQEVIKTTKVFVRDVFPIDVRWILEYAPTFYQTLQALGCI